MIDLEISKVTGEELRANAWLRAEIFALAEPSYEDPSALLDREIADANLIYLGREPDGRLVCFYMTTWERLVIAGEPTPSVHLGMSLTRQDTKNAGYVSKLYRRCLEELIDMETRSGERPILWSTTVSPTIYMAAARFLQDAEPRLDGSYSATGARIVHALRQRLKAPLPEADEHPFVVKGIATGTRYSEAERQRIEKVSKQKRFALFDILGIEEARQDRLVFIARVPESIARRALPAPITVSAEPLRDAIEGLWVGVMTSVFESG